MTRASTPTETPRSAGPDTGADPWRVDVVRPQDGPALAAMFARCSPETVRLRFFGRRHALPREYLDALLAGRPEVHDAVVAYRDGPDGRARLVGLGSLAASSGPATDAGTGTRTRTGARTGAGTDAGAGTGAGSTQEGCAAAELGLLVADAWQRRGAGAAMLDVLFARARTRGVEHVSASVLTGRPGLLAALGRRAELVSASRSTDALTGVYRLTAPPPPAGPSAHPRTGGPWSEQSRRTR